VPAVDQQQDDRGRLRRGAGQALGGRVLQPGEQRRHETEVCRTQHRRAVGERPDQPSQVTARIDDVNMQLGRRQLRRSGQREGDERCRPPGPGSAGEQQRALLGHVDHEVFLALFVRQVDPAEGENAAAGGQPQFRPR
jgi:hypothetical protein